MILLTLQGVVCPQYLNVIVMSWSQFFTDLLSFWFALLIMYVMWKILIKDLYYKICRASRGEITHATIVYLLDSLLTVQYQPMFYIQLRFDLNGHEVTTDRIKVLIRKNKISQYALGKTVKIKYDPKNINNVVILEVMD